jgi:hypothetical protein
VSGVCQTNKPFSTPIITTIHSDDHPHSVSTTLRNRHSTTTLRLHYLAQPSFDHLQPRLHTPTTMTTPRHQPNGRTVTTWHIVQTVTTHVVVTVHINPGEQ